MKINFAFVMYFLRGLTGAARFSISLWPRQIENDLLRIFAGGRGAFVEKIREALDGALPDFVIRVAQQAMPDLGDVYLAVNFLDEFLDVLRERMLTGRNVIQ